MKEGLPTEQAPEGMVLVPLVNAVAVCLIWYGRDDVLAERTTEKKSGEFRFVDASGVRVPKFIDVTMTPADI